MQIKPANYSKIFIEELLIKEISNAEEVDQKGSMGKMAVEDAFKKINLRYCSILVEIKRQHVKVGSVRCTVGRL